jgi:hypothetical protein
MRRGFVVSALLVALVGTSHAADDGVWRHHPDYPAGRQFPVWVYDSIGDRAVLTGGANAYERELTWTLGFRGAPNWDPLPTASTPSYLNLYATTHAFDPLRRRVIVTSEDTTWALRLDGADPGRWVRLGTYGLVPLAALFAAGFHDPLRDRLVIFGGQGFCPSGPSCPKRNDVRELSLEGEGLWAEVLVLGPAPRGRYGHTAVHDRLRDRAVFFGGTNDTTVFDEVWTLSFTGDPQWTKLATSGSAPSLVHAAAVWDSAGDRMVVFGGRTTAGWSNGTWALDLATHEWSSVAAANPPPAWSDWHRAFHDPVADRMVVLDASGKVWALNLRGAPQWTEVVGWSNEPELAGHTMVLDAARERLLVLGSQGLWAWSLEDDDWTPLPAPAPVIRSSHSAILDGERDRMVVFGGYRSGPLNDLWEYSLSSSTWSQIVPTGTPPDSTCNHVAIWDPRRDRMIVHGGQSTHRTFALDLATHHWTEILTAVNPGIRSGHVAAYDAARDRMIVFGGEEEPFRDTRDTWALSLSGTPEWSLLAGAGGPHVPDACTGFVDPVRDRFIVLTGGWKYQSTRPYALALDGTPIWTPLHPQGEVAGRGYHAAVYDARSDRMYLYGGYYLGGLGDTERDAEVHSLVWGTPAVDVPEIPRPRARLLAAAYPNPGRGEQTFELALPPGAGGATVEVLGVDGRRVWSRAVSGTQRVTWDGRDRFARALDPGVYWVVVRTAAGQRDRRRIVRLH